MASYPFWLRTHFGSVSILAPYPFWLKAWTLSKFVSTISSHLVCVAPLRGLVPLQVNFLLF